MPAKSKFAEGVGLLGSLGSWEGGGTTFFDFSFINVPATTGLQRVVLMAVPPVQTVAASMGAEDTYLNALAAATASKAAGQFNTPLYTVANPCLQSSTTNGTVVKTYAVTFTLQLEIIAGSSTTVTGIRSTLLTAAYTLNSMTNIWTPMVLNNIPAERTASLTGVALSNAFILYPGDILTALFANTGAGAVTVAGGDILTLAYEMV